MKQNFRKIMSIFLSIVMLLGAIPFTSVFADDSYGPVVEETQESEEETESLWEEETYEETLEETSEEIQEDPPESMEESISDVEYIDSEELDALTMQGPAALQEEEAVKVLESQTKLQKNEINAMVRDLFAAPKAAEQEEEIPRSGDGSNIESITAKWITKDTIDNGDDSLLYVRPYDDSKQSVRLQINYALSGEHNYEPGDITISIPAYMFSKRDGQGYGTMTIPYPADPSTKNDFNWKLVGDHYEITNTKRMDAATKGYIQFSISGLAPYDIADMVISDSFDAYIEVVTHKGNIIALRSNELTAQFDTEARVTKASKEAYKSATWVSASEIPASQRVPGEEQYIKVEWYVYANIKSNTEYILDYVDTIPNEYNGFIIGATSADGRTLEKNAAYTGHRDGTTNYIYVSTAYPASQFEPDTEYTFHNDVQFTLTELDPDQGSDPQLVTTSSATQSTTFSYRDPKWEEPTGHMMVVKNGNDGKNKRNLTHGYNSIYFDDHLWPKTGYYGIYASGLNELQDAAEDPNTDGILLSYTTDTISYAMPWMFDSNAFNTDEVASRKSINYTRPVRLMTEDTGLSLTRKGQRLTVGEDYKFISVEFPADPWVYTGVPQNINDDGSFIAISAGDGTFKYELDRDKSHWPDITLQIKRNGVWTDWATASWKSGSFVATLNNGTTTSNRVINVPADTETFRTVVTLQNDTAHVVNNKATQAAINYDVRPVVKLFATEDLIDLIDSKFELSHRPDIAVWNNVNMKAYDSENVQIVNIDNDGYDKLMGYTTDVGVYPSKSVTTSVPDYENDIIPIHYSAQVEERSVINDKVTYEQAIADGRLISETSGVWRDLLPVGVVPDMASIKLRPGDTITSYYTIPNYKGSGRTLLVVEANLKVSPKTYISGNMYYYEDVPSISFDATYGLNEFVDYGATLHNVIAFESGNDTLGTLTNYTGEPDDPYSSNNISTSRAFANNTERDIMKNLDPGSDNPNFVYAGVSVTLQPLSKGNMGLSKEVQVNNDGWWSQGTYYNDPEGNRRDVYISGNYSYKLRIVPDEDTKAKDMIVFDSLENFYASETAGSADNDPIDIDAPRWQGVLHDVDVSQIVAKGCAPVVYYSTIPNLQLSDESDPTMASATNTDITDTRIWTRASDYTGDMSNVKAVAVDMSKKADGSDFIVNPKESVVVLINMTAPSGSEAMNYIAQNAHAYNNVYTLGTVIDVNTGDEDRGNFIRKDYTKVGLVDYKIHVVKQWNDDNNRDGKRPSSVLLHLYANGQDTGRTETVTPVTNGIWECTFNGLPYNDANGDIIIYTIVEDEVPGYTETVRILPESRVLTNFHEPERINISGTKTWVGDTSEDRPSTLKFELYANGRYVKSQTIVPDSEGNWSYSFNNLFKYQNGEEIVYTVEEVCSGKGLSYIPSKDGYDFVNTYHPYGDLEVSKIALHTTDVSKETEFPFTFTFTRTIDGKVIPVFESFEYQILDEEDQVIEEGTVATSDTIFIKGGQRIYVKEIDENVVYKVEEEQQPGFTLTRRFSDVGTIAPNDVQKAVFENTYAANGYLQLAAEKKLLNRELTRYQFRYEMYDVTSGEEVLIRTATSGRPTDVVLRDDETIDYSVADVTFGAICYTEANVGKTYVYKVKETNTEKPGYVYDDTVYTVTVNITDNGDGTLSIEERYEDEEGEVEGLTFENEYKAEGEVTLRAWKDLKGRRLQDGEFEFELLDLDGDALAIDENGRIVKAEGGLTPIVATNDAQGNIVYPSFKFNEIDIGKTYTFVMQEKAGSDPTVNYDSTKYAYEVTVVDNGDGILSFNMVGKNVGSAFHVIDNNDEESDPVVPVFHNTLKDGSFSVSKYIDNPDEADPDQEFTFRVQLIGEDVTDDMITDYTLSPASSRREAPVEQERNAGGAGVFNGLNDARLSETGIINAKGILRAPGDPDIASGTSGTCSWVIDGDGVLRIYPTDGVSGTLASSTTGDGPWYSYRSRITKVVVESGVKAGAGCFHLFYNLYNCTEIDVSNLDTSNVTNMSGMFNGCSGLTSLDLSNFDTSNVTTMRDMFYKCSSLTSLNVSSFNTRNVRNMSYMFSGCSSLTSLNVSSFNTRNVRDMSHMFSGCSSLTSLDLSNFDTRNVGDMNSMFQNCSSLTSLNVSYFNTSNVVGAGLTDMFYNCSSLTSLNVLFFDTSAAYDLSGMFYNCSSLTSLNVWRFNTSNVTYMSNVFYGCSSLTSLNVSYFNTSNVTNMSGMFNGCSGLTSLDVSNWNTSNVTNMNSMFNSCSNLQSVKLGEGFSFKGKNITDTDKQAILSSPSSSALYTGKWIRNDEAYGPYTAEELRDNYTSELAGTWIWEEISEEYTLIFRADDAAGSMVNCSPDVYEDFTLPANAFVKFGYNFDHWDDGNGNEYADKATISANTYEADQTVILTAVFTPRDTSVDMQDGAFTFTLKGGEKATFDNIPAGTAYQIYELTPDGWVLIEQTNTSGMIEPLQESAATFTNRYQPGTTSAQFSGTKKLDGRAAEEGSFQFVLKEDGEEIQTVSVLDGGFIQFDAISYTAAGTHHYTIEEVDPENNEIDYDMHIENITVVISDDGAGNLSSVVTYDSDGIVFENTTRPGSLKITKQGENVTDQNKDDEFTFKITLNNQNGQPFDESVYWYVEGKEGGGKGLHGLRASRVYDAGLVKIGGILRAEGDPAIAGGTSGSCLWVINSDGVLTIRPSNGVSGTLGSYNYSGNEPGWRWYSGQIKKVVVAPGVKAGSGCYRLFYSFYNCTEMDISNLDTSNVTNMQEMFQGCSKLTLLDLSNFDTSKVTNMRSMFSNCRNLTSLDLSNFDTSNVTDMGSMFQSCNSITSLDLSNFDTSNVTNMNSMFLFCYSLKSVKLGEDFSFKGKNITDTSFQTLLPTPTGFEYSGKWIRNDEACGPYTPQELRDNYTSGMGGTWVWEVDNSHGIVLFDANGGFTSAMQIVATSASESITMPGNVTVRPHYVLTGWNTEADGRGRSLGNNETVNDIVELGSYVTLYAQWETTNLRDYKVLHYQQNLSLDGYSLVETEILQADKDTTVTPMVKDYDGFILPEPQSGVVTDDDSLVISYYYDRAPYCIIFNGNGATSGQMSNQKIHSGYQEALSGNTYKKTGSIFTGWNTRANGTGTSYTDQQLVKDLAESGETITLYAQWLSNDNEPLDPTSGVIYVTCKAGETIVIPELPAGTTYTIEEVDNPSGWTQTGVIGEDGVIVANQTAEAAFTNRYEAEGQTTPVVRKWLDGDIITEGQFTFELLDENQEVLQTVTNSERDDREIIQTEDGDDIPNPGKGSAPVEFNALNYTFDDIGEHTYYIRELIGNEAGMIYDDELKSFTVTVSDAGHGMLNAVVSYNAPVSAVSFTNERVIESNGFTLRKQVEHFGPASDDEFVFTIRFTGLNANTEYVYHDTDSFTSNADGVAQITVTLKDGEQYEIEGLPIGSAYTITEAGSDYFASYEITNDSEEGAIARAQDANDRTNQTLSTAEETIDSEEEITVTFTNKANELRDVSVQKVWNDDDDHDGYRPLQIEVQLLADNEPSGDRVTLTANSNWAYTWTDLQMYTEEGDLIAYTIQECEVGDKYTSTITGNMNNGFTVTNTHTPEVISIPVTKTWADNDNQDGKRPSSITIHLFANGEEVASATVTPGTNGEWSHEFTDLMKFDDGVEIVYTITEDAVSGYTTTIDGYHVTNSYSPETTNVSGSKTWVDNDNQDGKRPDSITINLLANGTLVDSKTVTAQDNWQYAFNDLPKYENGVEITYTITENAVAEYSSSIYAYNVTNRHTPETVNVEGTKTWDDANNQDGKRPASITINLLKNGTQIDSKTVTASDNWNYSFTNLPKYENGTVITYTITEDTVPEYTTSIDGYNVTNTHTPELTSVPVTKTWNDANNQDGKRPESITINLFADDELVDSVIVEPDSNDYWSYEFTDLPKYNDGTQIVYTITEDEVEGYTTTIDGYNVTNAYTPETIEIPVTKVWEDERDVDGLRPDHITVNMFANDEQVSSADITPDSDGLWNYTFRELPKYKEGVEIVYTITENEVSQYSTTIVGNANEGFTITNVHEATRILPETGGIGSAIVYFIGSLMALLAAVLLIMRRRTYKFEG